MIKNCAPFTDCVSEIKNTQINNAKDIDVVMYNLIEYGDNYSKISGGLCQCCRDEAALTAAGAISDFPYDDNNNSASFKFKQNN